MFGHQDDSLTTATPAQTVNPALDSAPLDGSLDAPASFGAPAPVDTPSAPSMPTPAPVLQPEPSPSLDLPMTLGAPLPDPQVTDAPASSPSPSVPTDANDLLDIKQQALQQLTPLVDHLEQTPEEKFRTTMMMIQAADNKDLLKAAYDAAQAIPDDKTRAQALLDIVNEINYFTQRQQ